MFLVSSTDRRRVSGRCILLVFLVSLAPLVSGCGEGIKEFPTAPVTGMVSCEGNPVANARVYFSPKSTGSSANVGKSGWATTTELGTFVISTYGNEDGAVVGTHRVSVAPPHPERFPDFTCDCETGGNTTLMEVDVVAEGENVFAIELTSKDGKRQRPALSDEDLDDIQDRD